MKKLLIIAGMLFFLTGIVVSYATVTSNSIKVQTELTDDDPTAASTSEPNDTTNCPKKDDSAEKKPCCKKHDEAGCHKEK